MTTTQDAAEINTRARTAVEDMGLGALPDVAADQAATLMGMISAFFTGIENGYRLDGGEVQTDSSVAGTDPLSAGPGILFKLPPRGSVGLPEIIRGPRLSAGGEDRVKTFRAARESNNYKAWDAASYDHPSLSLTVPVVPGVGCLIVALSSAELFPATTTTRLSSRIIIGNNGVQTENPSVEVDASEGPRHYCHRAQQWYTSPNIHIRRILSGTYDPSSSSTLNLTVRLRLYREGTAGNNRLSNASLFVVRIPW